MSIPTVEGRRFTPGTREINVGKQALTRFKGLALGSDVKFGSTTWKVAGIFTADDASFESEVWGDNAVLMPALNRNDVFQSVTFRMKDPSEFPALKQRLDSLAREAVKPLFLVDQFKVVMKNMSGEPVMPTEEGFGADTIP